MTTAQPTTSGQNKARLGNALRIGVRVVLISMFGIYVVSCAAIVLGYMNNMADRSLAIEWVLEEIPVLRYGLFFAALLPVNLALSFFASRGNYRHYVSGFLVLSALTPMMVALVTLPGKLELPAHVGYSQGRMLMLLYGGNYLFCRLLAKKAWFAGGRELDS